MHPIEELPNFEVSEFGRNGEAFVFDLVKLDEPITTNPGWNQAYASRTALKRWAHVSEMAGPLVFLVSDAASYITATVIHADAGWTAIDGRYDPPV